jgi:hypothetical protein
MAQLASMNPYAALAMTVVSAYTQAEMGKAAAANARVQAIQQERDANQVQVASQHEAALRRRQVKLLTSRARAVTGASGAGVTDPTVNKLVTEIEAAGEADALTALWEGDYTARALRLGATSKLTEARVLKAAGYASSATTALAGGLSFYEKYGLGQSARGMGTAFGRKGTVRESVAEGTALGDWDNAGGSSILYA